MDIKVFELLGRELPSSVSDIREALDLLSTSIESAIDGIADKVTVAIKDKEYKRVVELTTNSEELNEVSKKIQEFILDLDTIIEEKDIDELQKQVDDEIKEKDIPNYSDYLVDTNIEHNLYEDLTHKRPCAFKIQKEKIEAKDWKDTLIKTINYLGKIDQKILIDFVDNPKMNGKKVIYFSRVKLPTMRAPRKIDSANIYIETNLSANGIRNLLIKALNKYNIKLSEYKVFLKADYSELH